MLTNSRVGKVEKNVNRNSKKKTYCWSCKWIDKQAD